MRSGSPWTLRWVDRAVPWGKAAGRQRERGDAVFGIGFAEILVILVVALLVFGPDRLPEMTRQAASFVRDLRTMVANARRDIAVSAQDLGIDEEDLRTLRALRNPKAFVRDKVLDGIDLEDLALDDDAPA